MSMESRILNRDTLVSVGSVAWIIGGVAVITSIPFALRKKSADDFPMPPPPKLGQTLDLPLTDVQGKSWKTKSNKVVLVLGGDCESCTVRKIDLSKLQLPAFYDSAVIYEGSNPGLILRSRTSGRFAVLRCTNAQVLTALSNEFVPRVYMLDGKSRLIAAQKRGENPQEFIDAHSK